MKARQPACGGGFTLIELLVVVTVIAILATLLLSALNQAKSLGRAAKCRSNLHQTHLALAMYVADGNHFPLAMDGRVFVPRSLGTATLYEFLTWQVAIRTYVSDARAVFKCPEPEKTPLLVAIQISDQAIQFKPSGDFQMRPESDYGYNAYGTAKSYRPGSTLKAAPNLGLGEWWGGGQTRITAESDVYSPANMIAIGDGPSLEIDPFTADFQPRARHRAKAQIVFCDGHSEGDRKERWTAKVDVNASHWNNDNEAHPETW